MTALYKIVDEYRIILESLEDGELDATARERLDSVEHDFTKKAINIAAFIRNTEVMAKAIEDAEEKMRKRRQAMEARILWLRKYLLENMESTNISKIDCPLFELSIRKNPVTVDVFDIQASLS